MISEGKPDYTNLSFPDPPNGRPYVYINMIMSTDGRIVIDDTEEGLGSAVDRKLMRELRVNADIVLCGASTLRINGASSRLGDPNLIDLRKQRNQTDAPIAAVVTNTGNLPLDSVFFQGEDFEAVVYVGTNITSEKLNLLQSSKRKIFQLPAENSVKWMLNHMRHNLGARYLLLEGGSNINGQFLSADLIDEYFLTIGPKIVNNKNPLTPFSPNIHPIREKLANLKLVSVAVNEKTDEVYLRYKIKR